MINQHNGAGAGGDNDNGGIAGHANATMGTKGDLLNNKLAMDKSGVDSNQKIDLKKLMMISMKSETSNEKDFYKRSLEMKFGNTPPVQSLSGGKSLDLNVALPELKKNFEYDDIKFFDNFEQKFTDLIEDKHNGLYFPNL